MWLKKLQIKSFRIASGYSASLKIPAFKWIPIQQPFLLSSVCTDENSAFFISNSLWTKRLYPASTASVLVVKWNVSIYAKNEAINNNDQDNQTTDGTWREQLILQQCFRNNSIINNLSSICTKMNIRAPYNHEQRMGKCVDFYNTLPCIYK